MRQEDTKFDQNYSSFYFVDNFRLHLKNIFAHSQSKETIFSNLSAD